VGLFGGLGRIGQAKGAVVEDMTAMVKTITIRRTISFFMVLHPFSFRLLRFDRGDDGADGVPNGAAHDGGHHRRLDLSILVCGLAFEAGDALLVLVDLFVVLFV
jgi:hypothetical protein